MLAFRLALGLLASLVFASAALAAEVRGRAIDVDLAKKQLQLARPLPRGGPTMLVLDANTRVLFGKEIGTLADVPTGRRVLVVYEEKDGKALATTIRVPGKLFRRPGAPSVAPTVARGGAPAAIPGGITGTLRRVAPTERELVLIGPGAGGPETETIVAVPEKVRPTRDAKAIRFDELREGETATVGVEKKEGRWVATAVHVGAAPAAAAPAQTGDVVRRVRFGLWVADQLLKQMDQPKK